MPLRHRLLALLVAVLWGLNFLAIDASLGHFPPFFLVALRFTLLAIPTLLLVPRPDVPWRWLIGYGLGFGTFQFLFLYAGMAAGLPAGIASLVLQASAPATLVLGAVLLRERVRGVQIAGIVVAVVGLIVVGIQRAELSGALPFLLVVAGALSWSVGNLCNRKAAAAEPMRFAMWMSIVPPLPMLLLSLVVEGPETILDSLAAAATPEAVPALLGLLYTVVLGTVVASGIWNRLMARHPAGVVSPFSMLVPVVGMSAAWIVLGERVTAPELLGGALVVGGVLLGSRRSLPMPGRRRPAGAHPTAVSPADAATTGGAVSPQTVPGPTAAAGSTEPDRPAAARR
ncbi:EamA family transporter [Nesterenkonia halobia]|uniref:EamA family transporter n=1 Tax=Nesterenkonia halobia TaxID=37922 RepID=A0ABP6R7C2_9MICC